MNNPPVRVQRRRTPGWRMPANTIYVGRGSRWGNPFRAGRATTLVATDRASRWEMVLRPDTAADAVALYREWAVGGIADPILGEVLAAPYTPDDLTVLRGHNLACWCPLVDREGRPVACHADVLLELANQPVGAT